MVAGEVWGIAPSQVRRMLRAAGFEIVHEARFMLGVNRLTVAEKTDVAR